MDALLLRLLRIVSFVLLLCSVHGAPAMNAIKDENRLDDGIISPPVGGSVSEADRCDKVAGYMDLESVCRTRLRLNG
jgi:hypothetical protein